MNAPARAPWFSVFVLSTGLLGAANDSSAAGQVRQGNAAPAASAKPARMSRSSHGQPDLEGVWNFATITPLERPAAFVDKAVLTAEEAGDLERDAATRNDRAPRPGQTGVFNGFWWDLGRGMPDRRTSLVIDPPDGRIPFTPDGQQRAGAPRGLDSWEQRSLWERCITRSAAPLMPAGYNNSAQIVQAPGYVVILVEAVHDVRVIPIDQRPHLGTGIRQWLGDPRGHWDGNTLVVETQNFSAANIFQGAREDLRLVERFTRTAPDTLAYEFRVESPTTYTRPWTASTVLSRDAGAELYEYACHEGNSGLVGILNGARVQERAARSGARPE
jgi:hypothetical protein